MIIRIITTIMLRIIRVARIIPVEDPNSGEMNKPRNMYSHIFISYIIYLIYFISFFISI